MQPFQIRVRIKTFRDLTFTYLSSPAFLALSPSSRLPYRRVVANLCDAFGHLSINSITRADIESWLATRTPGAANDDLKKLRILMRFALERGLRSDDPTTGIRRFPPGEGHHSWSEQEIATYEARWPIGTCERAAFALLLFTGQRRSDVARLQWESIVGDRITLKQRKTGARLVLPVHSDLNAALNFEIRERRTGAILKTKRGHAISEAGFGMWMARKIAASGLPDRCVTHGLRKAAARRLAEAGCTAHEIAAITGHRTLREVERYTQAARQERLAEQALSRLRSRWDDV